MLPVRITALPSVGTRRYRTWWYSFCKATPRIGRESASAAVAATLKLRKERRNHAGVFDSNNFGLITREQPAPQCAPEHMGRFHGACPLCIEISPYVLRRGAAHLVPRHLGRHLDADRHFPRNRYSGRHSDLDLYGPEHAGNGATGHDLWRIFDQFERERHQGHPVPDPQRHLGPEDILPTRRQYRPRHRADRLQHQFDTRHHAGQYPGPDGREVQRLERAGATGRFELGRTQRTAALRLRQLSAAPTP